MGVGYPDEQDPWDYSGKELPPSFRSGVLPTSCWRLGSLAATWDYQKTRATRRATG